ncbi:MAG: H-NS histone family protein [Tistlia sp.]|uniref:H-NS histone family protein n=1 Tax=Tistlia sp. TaxID=3057121 RepID=UPI0034A0DD6A
MPSINLDKMSVKELNELIANAQASIAKKQKEERKTALKDARNAAAKWGFDLDDLVGGAKKSAGRKTGKRQLKPKFRHPENPDLTWSGVGRKPKWVLEAEAAGKIESMRVQG